LSSQPSAGTSRRPALLALTLIAATFPLGLSASTIAQAQPAAQSSMALAAKSPTRLYVVQAAGNPVATYRGSIDGYAATRPSTGKLVRANTDRARAYSTYLSKRHDRVLARAGVPQSAKTAEYSVAFNGFAARLTRTQAAALRHQAGVLRVWRSEVLSADTVSTPRFLGLDGRRGTWAREFGGTRRAGQGIIVGVIDSGFWPENPSFAALPLPRPDRADIAAQWQGTCEVGVEEPVTCNNKVIGARYYNAGGLAADYEFLSPRDFNGHGSHTASTAAGDHGVPVVINGQRVGKASGMAPAARLAVYKALWHDEATGSASGSTADLVDAIDDAVADGVDVINYSVSGSSQFVVDPVEIAFLNAAAGGVFVAASAGNSGPTASTVAHNSPWLTTVAASTHDRGWSKTLTLGNGATYEGAGFGPAVPSSPLIDAPNAALPGADATAATLCFSDDDLDPANGTTPVLDPAKVAGKIVICQRGTNDRLDKSLAVLNAGGVGMILFNPTPNTLNADFHYVPSIHIDETAGAAVKAYAAANPGATASISASVTTTVEAPSMAAFSSAGPAIAGGGDLLKPDITAPGVDIIAAVAPPGNGGENFASYQGTSMSSPHIAGIAALIKSKHPNWAPMWIKSAIMTNATVRDNRGKPIADSVGDRATPLQFGSGHVRPGRAFNPGVVYDSTVTDWLMYGCGVGQVQLVTAAGFCDDVGSIDPSDLNYPSIAIGDLAGVQRITRSLTNITPGRATRYRATVQAPPGFTVKLSKVKFFAKSGQTKSFSALITRTTAPIGEWAFGSVTWRDKQGHVVRSPIAVRPVALAAPAEQRGTGTSGSATIALKAGYTGTLTTVVDGLVPATVDSFDLTTTGPDFDPAAPAASTQTAVVPVTVPAGTELARFATFDADYPAGSDIDVFVYRVDDGTLTLVGQSAGGTAEEIVTLTDPEAGDYEMYVDLFAAPTGTALTVEPNTWVVGSGAVGNLTASPASQSVTTGRPATVTIDWSGLTAGVRYLGQVRYGNGTDEIGQTIVTIG
jgi:subtilisin family serine protease